MSEEVEWETAKENFVPVKQGRPTSALVTPVSSKKRDKELEEAKGAFLAEIQDAEDPLPAWLKYIKWTQEQYSTQASRAELQHVLKAATRTLSATDRYKDDVRLLRIWVQYADCLTDPNSVFLYLQDHNIGRDHALLYEAYAAYLELKGNFTQADLVYQEGNNRLAKPLERLKQKHSAFKQRMAKRQERQMAEASLGMGAAAADPSLTRSTLAPLVPRDPTPQLDENGNPIRAARPHQHGLPPQQQQAASVALGVRPAPLGGSSAASRASSSRSGGVPGASTSLWVPGSSNGSSSSTSASQRQRSNSLLFSSLGVPGGSGSSSGGGNAAPRQLDVHVDEEFGPSGQGPIPTAFPPAMGQHAQLPGVAVATKENSSNPGVWAGTKLKQQTVFAGPLSNKIEVFEDEDSEDENGDQAAVPEPATAAQQPVALRQRLDAPLGPAVLAPKATPGPLAPSQAAASAVSRSALQLRQQQQQSLPSAAHQVQGSRGRHTGSGANSSTASAKAAGPAAAAGPPMGYDEALLKGDDGHELSFEEVRAAAWKKAHASKALQQQSSAPGPCRSKQQEEQPQPAAAASDAAAAGTPVGKQPRAPLQTCSAAVSSAAHAKAETQEAAASTTAAAAAAAAAAASLSGPRLQLGGHSCSSQPSQTHNHNSSSSGGSNSRAPMAASHRAAVPTGTGAAAAAMKGADAGNVTVNTRAAYEAVNGMFGGSDDTTTMHGFGRASATGSRSLAAGDPSGVTLNTRAAFDAMNGMFGGDDDTTTMHGFGRAAAAAAASGGSRSLAAGDPGGVTLNTRAAFDAMNGMFGGDDTTTMHGFGRAAAGGAGAAGMEPTVTINTRAAFDYMNGVFGGAADVTMGHTAALGGARRGSRKTSRLSMAAAAAAGARSSSHGTSLGVYEDTELISGPGMTAAGAAAGGGRQQQLLGLYEDTEFVGQAAAAAAGCSMGAREATAGGSDGLGLYEDTEFITRSVSGPAAGTSSSSRHSMAAAGTAGCHDDLGLYEDTELITRPVGGSSSGGGSGQHSSAPAGGGLGLYEDTEFITQPAGASSNTGAAASTSDLGLYEDTEFITHAVAAGAAGASRGGSAGSGSTMLLSKLDRLSLANEALSRGQAKQRQGLMGSQQRAPAGTASGLGVYEDTEFICNAAGAGGSSTLHVYADTEFLAHPVTVAAKAGAERQRDNSRAVCSSDDDGSTTGLLRVKENMPAATAGGWQQQHEMSARSSKVPLGALHTAAAATGEASSTGHGLSFSCSSSSGGSILQQHQSVPAYGGAGPSRLGPGSVPNSPGGASHPGTAASTPGRPPRTPGTPSAGMGILAQHMDSFDVMESPAVRAALAGMQQQPGTAGSSPAGSVASPGYGARENIPLPADGKEGQPVLQPRSMADRAARAAALQPISARRAELLGVQMDPHAAAVYDEAAEVEELQQQQEKAATVLRQSPGRALRSLCFGREHESSSSHAAGQP